MPLPYVDLSKLIKDSVFQTRAQFAIWRAASKVRVEATSTPNYAARQSWAKRELQGPSPNLNAYMVTICTTGQVFNNGSAVTDDQLQLVVDGLVDAFAAV